jgi:hypothetical protein
MATATEIIMDTIEAYRTLGPTHSGGVAIVGQWLDLNNGQRRAIAPYTRDMPGHDALARFSMLVTFATFGIPMFERSEFLRRAH